MSTGDAHSPDPTLASLRERAKELQCLYQVHEITHRLDLPLDEVGRQAGRGAAARLAARAGVPGARDARRPGVHLARLRRNAVGAQIRHPPARRPGRLGRGLLSRGMPGGRRGAVPERRATAHRHRRPAPRPVPAAAAARDHAQRTAGDHRASRRRRQGRVVGHHRLPPADRPEPAAARLAPHDQLPLLERRRRSAAAAAPLLGRRPWRGRRGHRRQPADQAQEHRPSCSSWPTRRSASPRRTWAREKSSAASRAGSGRPVGFPRRGGREPVHVARGHRRRRSSATTQLAVSDHDLSRALQVGLRVSLVRRFFTDDLEFINAAQAITSRSPTSTSWRTTSSARRPATASWAARAPVCSWPARSCGSPPTHRTLAGIKMPRDLVRRLGRLLRTSSSTTTWKTSTTASTSRSTRSGASTRTSSRSSRTHTSRPSSLKGLVARARRLRGAAAHRAQLEPARGPDRRRLLGQVQEPVPRQPGDQGGAARRRSSTPSPRSTPRCSGPTPSSTAPSAACSTSTRRWGS